MKQWNENVFNFGGGLYCHCYGAGYLLTCWGSAISVVSLGFKTLVVGQDLRRTVPPQPPTPTPHSALQSVTGLYLLARQKNTHTSLKLRVYIAKSGILGNGSFVPSLDIHFSSGGEPSLLAPKHSASSPHIPQNWNPRPTGDHELNHDSRNDPFWPRFVHSIHTTSQPNCEPQNSTVLYNYEVNEASYSYRRIYCHLWIYFIAWNGYIYSNYIFYS